MLEIPPFNDASRMRFQPRAHRPTQINRRQLLENMTVEQIDRLFGNLQRHSICQPQSIRTRNGHTPRRRKGPNLVTSSVHQYNLDTQ